MRFTTISPRMGSVLPHLSTHNTTILLHSCGILFLPHCLRAFTLLRSKLTGLWARCELSVSWSRYHCLVFLQFLVLPLHSLHFIRAHSLTATWRVEQYLRMTLARLSVSNATVIGCQPEPLCLLSCATEHIHGTNQVLALPWASTD